MTKYLYAVGDIHGCLAPVEAVAREIYLDIQRDHDAGHEKPTIVFLGDYVDRGPESCEVVNFVRHGIKSVIAPFLADVICLMGNHEMMMVDGGQMWYYNGGDATDKSYLRADPGVYDDDIEWMKNLPLYHREGNVVCV